MENLSKNIISLKATRPYRDAPETYLLGLISDAPLVSAIALYALMELMLRKDKQIADLSHRLSVLEENVKVLHFMGKN